jgi:hypothetical protein
LRQQRFEIDVEKFVADGANDGAGHAAHDVRSGASLRISRSTACSSFREIRGLSTIIISCLQVGRRSPKTKTPRSVMATCGAFLVKTVLSQPQARASQPKPIKEKLAARCDVHLRAVLKVKVTECL